MEAIKPPGLLRVCEIHVRSCGTCKLSVRPCRVYKPGWTLNKVWGSCSSYKAHQDFWIVHGISTSLRETQRTFPKP